MNAAQILVLLFVVLALAVGAFIVLAIRKRHSRQLRDRFGPEYDRVISRQGDVGKGEQLLEFRQKHREKFQLRQLSANDRRSYMARWNEVQARFVDDPQGSVTVADSLVTDVMQARGYPITNFEQRASDISVDHPVVVENYREAHTIALRHSRGEASTEDLRKALVQYRTLFEELLGETQLPRKEA